MRFECKQYNVKQETNFYNKLQMNLTVSPSRDPIENKWEFLHTPIYHHGVVLKHRNSFVLP